MDAKKEVIGPDRVWEVLSGAEVVHVASGQKTLSFRPDEGNRAELITRASGRTGNLRAPALRLGSALFIGFNASLYRDLAA